MATNESALALALTKAQGEMHNAPLNKVNPHFKSKYADLSAIREATLPALSKNGLSLVQYTTVGENGVVCLHTKLLHTSGESIEGAWPIQADKPQQMGSALTYARRYCWAAMCGITAEEDDDGNGAQNGRAANTNGAKNHNPSWRSRADDIAKEIRACGDINVLQQVWQDAWRKHISAMPPEAQQELTAIKDDKKAEFDAAVQARMLEAGD